MRPAYRKRAVGFVIALAIVFLLNELIRALARMTH